MRLDDLARQAADQAREQAARVVDLDLEAYRHARQRRTQRRGFLVVGAFVTAALVVAIVVSPPEEELAAPTTTSIPGVVSTTLPSVTTTTIGPEPSIAPPPLGAGWEELDPGPIAGRYRMAVAWTDHGLFAWGGHDNYTQETPSNTLFHGNGFLYDPATETWSAITPPGQEFFEVGEARAVSMGDRVFLYGRPRAELSSSTAIYDIKADAWTPVLGEFGSIAVGTPVVWTGEYLVAPESGLGYDPANQNTFLVPVPPADADQAVHSPQRFHWGRDEVVAVGSGPVYVWSPGDEGWREIPGTPIPDRARDSVWVDDGLLVVNYEMATAFLNPAMNDWVRPGDLPLRFYECLPEAVSAGGTPVVRMCSGIAIWDEVRSFWVPIILSDLGMNAQGPAPLVGADDAIYTVGGDTFRRFEIERAADGSIVPPPTVPIGVMLLDIPEGWDLLTSSAPVQSPEGFIPEDETIGLAFWTDGDVPRHCDVESTYVGDAWQPPTGFAEVGPIAVDRPGRFRIVGTAYRFTSSSSDWGGTGFAFPDDNGSDLVWVMCEGYSEQTLQDAQAFAAGLWSPWEEPPSAEMIIGTGWDEVDESPVAGRMRTAVVWTGSEIFVWGGHDGYSQETPAVGAFHQDAYLFDPATGVWRMGADPPDGLCPLSEATATWIGDAVLVRGAAHLREGCVSNVARYDPQNDSWTVFTGTFFERVPYRAEVVWTGEWLVAPAFGVAWIPVAGGSQTIDIPVVPEAGSTVGSPTKSHWTGDRIVAVGAGDVYTLVPGDSEWVRFPGPPLREGGRDSVWHDGWLYVVEYDNPAARFDLEEWEQINLPLRSSECDPEKLVAGDLPVARSCSGLAVWDSARGFWVPIPLAVLSGLSWWTTLVGTDDAVYSFGETVLRYPIERLGDGSVANPPTIPVGVMQLDIPLGFWLRSTVGVTPTEWPDGSYGEVVAFAFEAPRGTCQVAARYGGPELPFEVSEVSGGVLPVWSYYDDESSSWVVGVGGESVDTLWIACDSDADAQLLIDGLWVP